MLVKGAPGSIWVMAWLMQMLDNWIDFEHIHVELIIHPTISMQLKIKFLFPIYLLSTRTHNVWILLIILPNSMSPGSNWLISLIPQCISQISHNAPFCNRNVHTCTFLLQNGALWVLRLVHYGVCATSLLIAWCQTDDKPLLESIINKIFHAWRQHQTSIN